MAWVRCLIRGENFPIDPDGKGGPVGFLATRYVDVDSFEDVERVALAALKQEPQLQVPPGTPGMEKARVFFDIIEPVEEPEKGGGTGFQFIRSQS